MVTPFKKAPSANWRDGVPFVKRLMEKADELIKKSFVVCHPVAVGSRLYLESESQ
jgi:hypothetical protein